jgi:hypothetical protein
MTTPDPFAEINLPCPEDIRKWVKERSPNATFLHYNFDPGLLGWTTRQPTDAPVAVYDLAVCRSIAHRQGWSKVRADDFFTTRYDKFRDQDPVYLHYHPGI